MSYLLSDVLHERHDKSRKEILIDAVENKSNYHHGIKTVLSLAKSNKNIIGVLGDLISTKEGYELAISSALAGALEFIVTTDDLTIFWSDKDSYSDFALINSSLLP